MLAAERRARIVELVQAQGAVSVSELVGRFNVSDMTIRRDLDALAGEHAVQKVHGGAVSTRNRRTEEPAFETKSARMEAQKFAVAQTGARLVEPGMSVALSAGTTTWALARHLREVPDLTVITNSTRISDLFHDDPKADRTVILTGGVRTRSNALVGPTAVTALTSMHVDLAFLGAHGVTAEAGCTTPNFLEAETNQALIAAARRAVVLADHSKWGVVGVMTFAQLSAVDLLITDDGLEPEAAELLADQVGELRRVVVEEAQEPG